jgi:hypothetical protein
MRGIGNLDALGTDPTNVYITYMKNVQITNRRELGSDRFKKQ